MEDQRLALLPSAPPLSREAAQVAVLGAARDLAALCRLDIRHFHYPGRERDPAFGSNVLATGCEILDLFGPLGPGEGPHSRDEALHARIRTAYAHRGWVQHYKALNAAFLAHAGNRRIPSPLSGGEAAIIGSIPIQHYQMTPCLDGDRLIMLIGIGYMPVGLYHPAENLFITGTNFVLNMQSVLRVLLDHFLSRPLLWAEWLRRGLGPGLRRAFLIGDNRPGHFMRQTLAYIDTEEEAILGFAAKGGLMVAASDLCAMDPFALFPSLAPLDRLSLRSERMPDTLLAMGLDAHRVYRFNIHPDAAWLRRRLAPVIEAAVATPVEGRRYRVMISLDAERERVVNAVEVFRFALRKLGEACAEEGAVLDVVWDGWTVPGEPSARDREVMGRIEAMIAAINEGLPSDGALALGEQRRIFDRSALEKVPDLARCDLAITTLGTGAMIVSWLLQRPTIVYQEAGKAANRAYLDDGTAVDVDPRAVEALSPDDPRSGGHQRFLLAPWGLEEALRRALAGRLTIRPE